MFTEKWWIQETELNKIWFLSLSTGEGVKDKNNKNMIHAYGL